MEIIKLIEKLNNGNISPEELERLEILLKEPIASKELLSSLQESFDSFINTKKGEKDIFPHKTRNRKRLTQSIQQYEKSLYRKSTLTKVIISLSITALLTIVSFVFLYKDKKSLKTTIKWELTQTSYGEKKRIKLSDGSTIIMNGNSSIYYTRSVLDSIRLVKLDGEAYFDIMPNDNKPFFVITNEFITQVVGTSFNIDSKIDKHIEVASGVVNMYRIDEGNTNSILKQPVGLKSYLQTLISLKRTKYVKVSAGNSARLLNNEWQISPFNNKNWHNKILVCLDEPICKVAEKVYRFYGDSIFVDPNLSMKKISITFNNATINRVVETLSELSDGQVEYDAQNKNWKIMKK